jgi:hypothetical protein
MLTINTLDKNIKLLSLDEKIKSILSGLIIGYVQTVK